MNLEEAILKYDKEIDSPDKFVDLKQEFLWSLEIDTLTPKNLLSSITSYFVKEKKWGYGDKNISITWKSEKFDSTNQMYATICRLVLDYFGLFGSNDDWINSKKIQDFRSLYWSAHEISTDGFSGSMKENPWEIIQSKKDDILFNENDFADIISRLEWDIKTHPEIEVVKSDITSHVNANQTESITSEPVIKVESIPSNEILVSWDISFVSSNVSNGNEHNVPDIYNDEIDVHLNLPENPSVSKLIQLVKNAEVNNKECVFIFWNSEWCAPCKLIDQALERDVPEAYVVYHIPVNSGNFYEFNSEYRNLFSLDDGENFTIPQILVWKQWNLINAKSVVNNAIVNVRDLQSENYDIFKDIASLEKNT